MLWKMKDIFFNAFESMLRLSPKPQYMGAWKNRENLFPSRNKKDLLEQKGSGLLERRQIWWLRSEGEKYEWNKRTGVQWPLEYRVGQVKVPPLSLEGTVVALCN